MRYIKSFENDTAIQAAVDNKTLGKPYVALDENTGLIDWNGKDIDYSKMYLTIEALSEGTIYWYANAENQAFYRTIEYSKNGGEWVSVTSSNSGSGTTICDVGEGDVVMFRGDNKNIWHNASYGTRFNFGGGLEYKVYGNIMSILYKDDFQTRKSFEKNYWFQFGSLFSDSHIIDASNLVLPATTLETNCYSNIFSRCVNLVKAPALPATVLKNGCYYWMFYGCTNLNYIKCLATDISANGCLTLWVSGVSPTGTFVKKAGVNWPTGASGIPKGWTVIEE